MTHVYNDYDTLLSDVWNEVLDEMEDLIRNNLESAIHNACPGQFADQLAMDRLCEDITYGRVIYALAQARDKTCPPSNDTPA